MNTEIIKKHSSKIFTALIVALFVFSAFFLWIGANESSQSKEPTIADVSFKGRYKIGNGDWQDYEKGAHIPANQDVVTLEGIFLRHNPETGEVVSPLSGNNTVNLYLNHIGGEAILPGGGRILFNGEIDGLGEDACAIVWSSIPATGEDPITIVLRNPHKYGNADAIDEMFEHMSIAPGIYFESAMLEKGNPERTVGIIVFIIAAFILGIAAFSTIIHIKYGKMLWLIGLMLLFAGGYFAFDAFAVSIWNDSNIINTRSLGLCMMLYMLFCTALIVTQLKGYAKGIGIIALSVSVISILTCICASLFGYAKFYDTWVWWSATESVISLALIVCQAVSLEKSDDTNKIISLVGISALFAFILDFIATVLGWWSRGSASKIAFLAVLAIALVFVLRVIPSYINAAAKARELEAEKQALKLDVQESRISIMLSQMQPHFIFNTLNTIYHLCEINPKLARSTIDSFSTYLRNNIDNLDCREMIPFDKEFSFVKAYLDIEKVRFDDELQISFDLPVTDFMLPVLTMQPIVENAVKHGTSKKEGCSTLSISTRETDTAYEIEIRDTGVGFDTYSQPNDEHKHIGITNVRHRLEQLCGGTLTIESTVGQGTTAIIQIPKREERVV